jgi:hypothetical protein
MLLSIYDDCESCSLNNDLVPTCIGCKNGFLYTDPSTGQSRCVSTCPYRLSIGGMYGIKTFKKSGSLGSSVCLSKTTLKLINQKL